MHVIAIKPAFVSLGGLCERGGCRATWQPFSCYSEWKLGDNVSSVSVALLQPCSRLSKLNIFTWRALSPAWLSSSACCWHAHITGRGLRRLVCGSLTRCPLLDLAHVLYIYNCTLAWITWISYQESCAFIWSSAVQSRRLNHLAASFQFGEWQEMTCAKHR